MANHKICTMRLVAILAALLLAAAACLVGPAEARRARVARRERSRSLLQTDDHGDDHADEEEHAHGHGHHICACEAKEFGFGISCTALNMNLVKGVMQHLEDPANNCNTSMACEPEYVVLQTHHDFCPHDVLPTDAEKVLHDFEDFYSDCIIPRSYDPSLPNCPAVECGNADLFKQAAAVLENNDCSSSCDNAQCKDAIKTILMGHDTCDESALPIVVEKALHDHEDACEEFLCNSRTTPYDPADEVCDGEEDHEGEEHSDEEHSDEGHSDEHSDEDHSDEPLTTNNNRK